MMTEILPPSYALPRLDELIGPWTIPSWLKAQYEELGKSDKIYNRFAAMGLVTNRFLPVTNAELEAFVESNYDKEFEKRTQAWLMAQTPEDMKEVAHLAELEALSLVTEFDVLEARKWPINDLILLALAREILESVAILLRRRGYGSRVLPLIAIMDEQADKRIPFATLLPPSFRPQTLLAVRGLSPRKWWGRVLGPFS